MTKFERALEVVLTFEGGSTYTNDPRDPGGRTRWGISQKAYPLIDVENLTREEAERIYRRDYWEPCCCDELPGPLALLIFDAAVQMGVRQASTLFQQSIYHRPSDGVIGPKTLAAAKEANVLATITGLVLRRWDYYRDLSISVHYLRGWTSRLFRLQAECLMWAFKPEGA